MNFNRKLTYIAKRFVSRSSYEVQIFPEVEKAFDAAELKHKHHPGVRSKKPISLSASLQSSLKKYLENINPAHVIAPSQTLKNQLWCRQLPMEKYDVEKKLDQLQEKYFKTAIERIDELPDEVRSSTEDLMNKILKKKAQEEIYHWTPINYDKFGSQCYLFGRMCSDYAAVSSVLNEIKLLDPSFIPKTVFDFGSGVGTVHWVVKDKWPGKLQEYFSVDISADMNDLARSLIVGNEDDEIMEQKGIFQRQFLPTSDKIKYDLVVSAFSLMELPSIKNRIETLDTLWQKTSGMLVIIENGTHAGYSAVMEARDYILKKQEKEMEDIHLVAPCPHMLECPRQASGSKSLCCFRTRYENVFEAKGQEVKEFLYSYVILSRKKPTGNTDIPRIITPVLPRGKHTVCRVCCNDGHLHEFVFTKSKHSKNVYRMTRNSKWGDQLPVTLGNLNDSDG